jgi:predicted phage tail protein
MTATASDPQNQLTKVEFYNGATLLGTATASPYSFTWSSVPAGTYSLTAMAYDGAGLNTRSSPVSVTVTAANQPPTVSLTAPANGASFTAPATITITATASDPQNQLTKVEFYNGATLLGTATAAPYSFTWLSVVAGTYSVTAMAYDAAGLNTRSAAVSVTVTASVSPPTGVEFTASADDATVTSYRIDVFAAGADPNTATPVASLNAGKPTPDANNNITVSAPSFFSALALGNYQLTVSAINANGIGRSSPVAFTR